MEGGGQTAQSSASAAANAAASGFNPVFSIAKPSIDPKWVLGGIALIAITYLIGKR